MAVYSLLPDANNYQNLILLNSDQDLEALYGFNGTPIGPNWQPLSVEIFDDNGQNRNLPRSDFPAFIAPVFSRRAVEALGSILSANGELLPLNCDEDDYFAFNVTQLVDALNEANSDVVRFSDGRIMDIKRFGFDPDKLKTVDIFKIPQMPLGRAFVRDRFVQKVHDTGLTGFVFKSVSTTK